MDGDDGWMGEKFNGAVRLPWRTDQAGQGSWDRGCPCRQDINGRRLPPLDERWDRAEIVTFYCFFFLHGWHGPSVLTLQPHHRHTSNWGRTRDTDRDQSPEPRAKSQEIKTQASSESQLEPARYQPGYLGPLRYLESNLC